MFKRLIGKKENERRKVIVLTADHGLVGRAILPALVSRKLLDVYAGVQDPQRFGIQEGVTTLKTDMDDKKAIHKVFKKHKFDRVIVVVPGNRPDWAENALDAADHSKCVKFVVAISLIISPSDTFFGANYNDMEMEAKRFFPFGHCIVRLPQLMDAMAPLYAKSIKEEGVFVDPRDPTMPFRCISLSDVGKAVTQIILRPGNHEERIYNLLGPSITINDQVEALSKATGKKITCQDQDYDEYRETLEAMKVPEWSIHGTFEIYNMIDEADELINLADTGDFEAITGDKPMSLQMWCNKNVSRFR